MEVLRGYQASHNFLGWQIAVRPAVAVLGYMARGHRPPNLAQVPQIFNWFYSNFA